MNPWKWKLILENVNGVEQKKFISVSGGWWLKLLSVLGMGMLMSRIFFLQVVMGNKQTLIAEGNRLEKRVLLPDRGAIRDVKGRILARNVMKEGKSMREYPYGEVTAHVIGYVGEVSSEELELDQGKELSPGIIVGKIGIEKSEDVKLRGVLGEELVETDALGKDIRVIGKREAIGGQILDLTIEAELQKKIFEILTAREKEKGEFKGAVIVSRVSTGEILALVSWPSFNPNLFSGGEMDGRYSSVAEILGDIKRQPMFDRAIAGAYPPGSIYKLVTAAAGLVEGKIDAGTTVLDEGEIKIGEYRYGNWFFDQYGQTEGEVDLKKALARSNDIYFYKVGEWVGVDLLGEWSRKAGLGKRTDIGLGYESSGRVPDPLWKEKLTGERWFLGNTYHMAIGQGDLEVTPLQGNLMTVAVVGGKWCKPKLIKGEKSECESLGIKEEYRSLILEGMKGACSTGGTAFSFFDFKPQIACKTGTAQHGGEDDEPHAWITAVIPNLGDNKEDLGAYENGTVITVLLEAAGEGSKEAGPVATEIAKYMVEQQIY